MCVYPSSNHSTDTVAVYHGHAQPTVLCGFHASWPLPDVLAAVRHEGN